MRARHGGGSAQGEGLVLEEEGVRGLLGRGGGGGGGRGGGLRGGRGCGGRPPAARRGAAGGGRTTVGAYERPGHQRGEGHGEDSPAGHPHGPSVPRCWPAGAVRWA
ncbi:hypothetical protein EF912_35060, partial [Streptomyces sp. WAC07061]